MMRKIIKWISLWPSVALMSLICGEIIFRYPCNHGAGFYCYLYPVCGLIVVSFVYGFPLNGSKAGICLSLLCLILILCADWFNVYVDYDTWISRGMPNWGHLTSVEKKYIEATSVHDAYFIYKNVDCLIAGEGQELSQFLPQEATDIWISHESGFGYEDWEVSCVVSETDFRRLVNERLDMRMSVIDVFGLDPTSYKMCNLFYEKRLGISQEAISRIRTRDRFLECYVHDKDSHWHLTYCYDRISNILFCGFGR